MPNALLSMIPVLGKVDAEFNMFYLLFCFQGECFEWKVYTFFSLRNKKFKWYSRTYCKCPEAGVPTMVARTQKHIKMAGRRRNTPCNQVLLFLHIFTYWCLPHIVHHLCKNTYFCHSKYMYALTVLVTRAFT